jgi:CRP-like cAMP-binding protein
LTLVPKEDFIKLLYSNRDVASRFIKILVDNISEKEEQLLQLAYDSIRKRVADALLMLHEKEQASELSILRDDLARIVGTAKESVIRMLTEFKQDRYIDIKGGNIHILNKKGLESMPG